MYLGTDFSECLQSTCAKVLFADVRKRILNSAFIYKMHQGSDFREFWAGSVSAAQGVYKAATQGFWIFDSHVRMVYAKPKDVKAAGPAAAGIGSGAPPPQESLAHATAASAAGVPEGFLYDENSGWYYSATTNYYYDANSQIYYEPTGAKYYQYDVASQQYVECEAGNMSWGANAKTPAQVAARRKCQEVFFFSE
jgi:hypothetical protein